MKKILLVLSIFLMLPCYANVEICIDENHCRDFPENTVNAIETTVEPTYGVNVVFKNGDKLFLEANTRGSAVLMMMEGYESLKEYYHWSDDYYYNLIEQQDKAHLIRH